MEANGKAQRLQQEKMQPSDNKIEELHIMKQINMLESPVRQVFSSYLVPSISATLVTSIYILADTMMIGRGVGGSGIAAMNILLPLYNTYFGIGMMCGVGGSVLFGFSRGRGDEKRARSYFTTALCMVLALASAFLVLGRIFFTPIINFMGNTPLLNEYTVPYGTVLTTAAPMFALSTFLQAFVRNDGAPKLAMAGVISGGVTNVILDYIYIFIMKWGMGGAALATATGTTLTVLILSSHFFSKNNHLKLEFGNGWKHVPEIFGNGLASLILEVSNGFVMLLFNRQLLTYVGEIGITVYGIITNTALVASSVSNGIAQAVQPLLSANFGAGNTARVGEARKMGIRTGFIVGLIFTAVGMLFPVQLSCLFLEPTPEILTMAVPAIRLYFLGFLVSEWNIISGTYFQATVRPRSSLTLTLLRGVILNSVFVFLLPALFGVDGIWLAVTVSEFITAFAAFCFMKKEKMAV